MITIISLLFMLGFIVTAIFAFVTARRLRVVTSYSRLIWARLLMTIGAVILAGMGASAPYVAFSDIVLTILSFLFWAAVIYGFALRLTFRQKLHEASPGHLTQKIQHEAKVIVIGTIFLMLLVPFAAQYAFAVSPSRAVYTGSKDPWMDEIGKTIDKYYQKGDMNTAFELADWGAIFASWRYSQPALYRAGMFHWLGLINQRMNQYDAAEEAYKQSDAEYSRIEAKPTERALNLSNDFGDLYFERGELEQAGQKYERSLNALEVYPDSATPVVFRGIVSLVAVLLQENELDRATVILEKADEMQKVSGMHTFAEREAVLVAKGRLAFLKGDEASAEALYKEALELLHGRLDQQNLAVEKQKMAANLNLAELYTKQGREAEAKKYRDASIGESSSFKVKGYPLGHEYAEAKKLYDEGELDLAEAKLKKVVEDLKANQFPDTYLINPRKTLAALYRDQEKYDEAIPLVEENISAVEDDSFHTSHYCLHMHQLAVIRDDQGKSELAEKIYLKAIEACDGAFPQSDLHAAPIIYHLAKLYDDLGRYDKAEKYYLDALAKMKSGFGEVSSNVADIKYDLAALYDTLERYEDSEKMYLETIELDKKLGGDKTVKVAKDLNDLGLVYDYQEKYTEAKAAHEQALAIREEVFGKDSIEVSWSAYNLANVYAAIGDKKAAKKFYKRTLAIEEKVLGSDSGEAKETRDALEELK